MAYDEDLADRVRELTDGLDERRMFGGLAFLAGGHMAVCVSGKGGLMVRVDRDESEALVAQPQTRRMEMNGRELDGWLYYEGDDIAPWVERGVAFARSLPPKR